MEIVFFQFFFLKIAEFEKRQQLQIIFRADVITIVKFKNGG